MKKPWTPQSKTPEIQADFERVCMLLQQSGDDGGKFVSEETIVHAILTVIHERIKK